MKQLAFIITAFLISVQLAGSDQIASHYYELLDQGNELYKNGDYQAAREKYEAVTNAGYESAALYFNLGNAHFKLKQVPAAILFYERAKRLSPNDADIRFNLDLANKQIVDKMEPLPKPFFEEWWEAFINARPVDNWARQAIGLFLLGFVFLTLYLLSSSPLIKKLCFWTGIASIILSFIVLVFCMNLKHGLDSKEYGIVFSPTVTVLSQPNLKGTQLFVIHEGIKVKILEEDGSWYRIALPDGNDGWLKTDDLVII